MIITCPSCATRYTVDGARFPAAGRTVRCSKCAHSWHQAGEAPEQEAPAPESPPPPAPEPGAGAAPEAAQTTHAADPVFIRDMTPAAASAPARKAVPPGLAVAAGWVGLIAMVVLIAVSAVRYRQDIAVIWPQSAGVYSGLGLPVNDRGIDFRQVNYKRQSEDGQVVLAVSGRIVNTGPRELPVPQTVRVTLSDADNRELYHWTFKPNASTLKPGQSVPFATRLSSPPATARHLEVRFSKDAS
ncbi:MAG: hypothetical protein BGN85_13450 [Alphaproteobacteria bacterium 64-11]|nr:zinc-ribbon domain-containing protein [Alphaproteobacteria bacterium]OJU13287.1 MAG: hypothetical protein BGN85_13450 [Alphaproteobacteria bacterium 64-11]